jgi:hypothetical protein
MKPDLRQLCLPLAVLAAVGLSACGSSSKAATAPQQPNRTTSAATSSSPTPSPTLLTKAQFVAKMDAVCVDFTTRIQRLPQPGDEQDYANLAAFLGGTLTLFPQYMKQAESLVSRAADQVTLRDNWLSVEQSDFAASEPAFTKLVADVKAKRRARLAADTAALEDTPDHSEAIAGFMSGYGLKSCAILERS